MIRKNIKDGISFCIKLCAHICRIDLIKIGKESIGIGWRGEGYERSGERRFVQNILPKIIQNNKPILYDIGANVGTYTSLLQHTFPEGCIHAFEPNPHSFSELLKVSMKKTICTQKAVGAQSGVTYLYLNTEDTTSGLATLHKEIQDKLHTQKELQSIEVSVITLDSYTQEQIDFLKIDTEGHELEVLKGATALIKKDKIKVIQFEFNEMNIVTKAFLLDFYNILKQYSFYRITPKGLISLGQYSHDNEIFDFQNIVAIHSKSVLNVPLF